MENKRHPIFNNIQLKFIFIYLCIVVIITSCEKDSYRNSISGFQEIEKDLLEKFGEKSYYTDVTILQHPEYGMEINLLVTDNPYSFAMEGWNYKNGDWQMVSEVQLELGKGNIENYMYNLHSEVNIVKLGFLVNLCIERTKEDGFKNPIPTKISITSPNKGDKSRMNYVIRLEANNKKISYIYSLEGDLIDKYVL
ncbi:hypothetical protein [Aquimarina addita]|uniref:hypothetical protein n=1 Tax=Aquimarina addita TaxID=870485 RepID=UPI0031E95BC0